MARSPLFEVTVRMLVFAALLPAAIAQATSRKQDAAGDPAAAAREFPGAWQAVAADPQLSAAQRQQARAALLAGLLPIVGRLDAATRASLATVVRATPLAEEAARAFGNEARTVSQRLLTALGARVELPEGRIRSIRLLEADGAVSGVVVTLDDGRERSVPTGEQVDGVRLELLAGAALEPVGLLHVDGKVVRCFPRAGLIVPTWPVATRRAWLGAFFGPKGSSAYEGALRRAAACLRDTPKSRTWFARAQQQIDDPAAEAEWTSEEIAAMDPGVPLPPNLTEDEAMWATPKAHPDAPMLCAWVGGRDVLAESVERAERLWLSLAWIARMPAEQRKVALGWVMEELDPQLKACHLQPPGNGANDPQPLPDAAGELAALAGREADLAWSSLAIDGGAGAADRAALLRVLEARFAALGQRSEQLRKLEAGAPAPSGLQPDLQRVLFGWMRRDPEAANPADEQFAREIEPGVRLLAGIGAGEPLDFGAEPCDDWGHPPAAPLHTDTLFELASFRFSWLAGRDLPAALAEFAEVWAAVPKVFHPPNVQTMERRDSVRRALLRALLLQRQRLDAAQRASYRALVAASDVWAESADAFTGEATAVCETIRRRIAAAAQADIVPEAFGAQVQSLETIDREGAVAGVRLGLSDGQKLELVPGKESRGFRVLALSDAFLDPLVRIEHGGDRTLLFPWSGFCVRDWPDLPRGAWLRARYGEGSGRWKLMTLAAGKGPNELRPKLPAELWARIEKALADPDVDPALTPGELDQILALVPGGRFDNVQNHLGAWLAPQVVAAGEVDCEERFWRTLARVCRIEDAGQRAEEVAASTARFDRARKTWMDPTPMTRLCMSALLARTQVFDGVLAELQR